MYIPSVMQIYMALNTLPIEKAEVVGKVLQEFRMMGPMRLSKIEFPVDCTETEKGYLLGLAVSEVSSSMTDMAEKATHAFRNNL